MRNSGRQGPVRPLGERRPVPITVIINKSARIHTEGSIPTHAENLPKIHTLPVFHKNSHLCIKKVSLSGYVCSFVTKRYYQFEKENQHRPKSYGIIVPGLSLLKVSDQLTSIIY